MLWMNFHSLQVSIRSLCLYIHSHLLLTYIDVIIVKSILLVLFYPSPLVISDSFSPYLWVFLPNNIPLYLYPIIYLTWRIELSWIILKNIDDGDYSGALEFFSGGVLFSWYVKSDLFNYLPLLRKWLLYLEGPRLPYLKIQVFLYKYTSVIQVYKSIQVLGLNGALLPC